MKKLRVLFLFLFVFACNKEPLKEVLDPQPEPLPPGEGLGFIFVGDTGTGANNQYKVGDAMAEYCEENDCDFGLLLGDNIYSYGVKTPTDSQFETKFEKPFSKIKFPFYVTLGNHDAYWCWMCQIHYKSPTGKWIMPAQYYNFKKGNAEFFAMDTTWDYFRKDPTLPQHDWIEQKLKASTAKWKFVFGHHPVYSNGEHGNDSRMIKYLLPKLKKYNVDFYLNGHDHDKQLLHPFSKDELKIAIAGSGAKLRKIKQGKKYSLFARSSLGFGHVFIKDDKLTLRFVGLNGIEYQKVYRK